jgi:hypothetical protein
MARPNDGWGSPLLSQDIIDNYPNTHHEVDGVMILNDEDYLNSLYDEDNSVSDGIVLYSNHLLVYDDNYIAPDDNESSDEDDYIDPFDNDYVDEYLFNSDSFDFDDNFEDEDIW